MARSRTDKQPLPDIPPTAWLPEWTRSVWGVAAIFVAYACFHSALRLTASLNLPQDDVMAVLYSQTLELGYSPRQPPLYDWMLWAVQQVTGPSLISFLLLKYALLSAAGVFVYLAGLRIYGDKAWAALAAFSLLLLYQIGWNIHEGVTHTSAMICAIAATFWAFTRVIETGAWRDYALLGLALGLGGLTKYGFAAFVFLLLGATLLQPAMRPRVLSARMAAAGLLAGTIIAPFALWVALNDHDLAAIASDTLAGGDAGHWQKAGRGAWLAVRSTLTFLSPLILIVPLIFFGALAAMRGSLANAFRLSGEADWEKLLLHMAIGALIMMLLGALLAGASTFRMRYMHPFYLLMPLWVVAMARRGVTRYWQPAAFVAVSVAFALIVLVARLGYLYVGEKPFCAKCRQMIPYEALADSLRDQGFERGTIIASYRHTAGNMRRLFPEARVVALRRPRVVPPIRPGDRRARIAVVWDVDSEGSEIPPGAAEEVAALGASLEGRRPFTIRVPWSHLWRPLGYRNSIWKLIVIDRARD